jgi:hypothetical protein
MKTLISLLVILLASAQARAQETQGSRKHFRHTLSTGADPQKIWQVWTDVTGWHTWDTGLKAGRLNGPFVPGARGQIISLEGRKSAFRIVALEPGKSYTFKTSLPLGGLFVRRSWEEKDGTIYFTHEVWFSGLTGGLFARQFGDTFREMLPQVMQNVKQLAESHEMDVPR